MSGGIRGLRAFPLEGKLPLVSLACVSGGCVLPGEPGRFTGDVDQGSGEVARV